METYRNFKCNPYHIYGDSSGKNWSYQELKRFFNIDGSPYAECITDFTGDQAKREHYNFNAGEYVSIRETFTGFEIR